MNLYDTKMLEVPHDVDLNLPVFKYTVTCIQLKGNSGIFQHKAYFTGFFFSKYGVLLRNMNNNSLKILILVFNCKSGNIE